jgi:hypothetical protein
MAATRGGHLCHPVPLLAVLLLAVNDHLLKGSGVLPGTVTGKLSDFAGLFFFPLLLAAVGWDGTLATGAVAAVFTALKTWPSFNHAVSPLFGENVLDPTDLWALLALVPSWLWMRRERPPRVSPRLHRAAVIAAALASMATTVQRGKAVRNYPAWTVRKPARVELGCASAEVWVVKSGKEGLGATVELSSARSPCTLRLRTATLTLRAQTVQAGVETASLRLESAPRDLYLPFLFDGDAAWNDGDREATLRLEADVEGSPEAVDLKLVNQLGREQLEWIPEERR